MKRPLLFTLLAALLFWSPSPGLATSPEEEILPRNFTAEELRLHPRALTHDDLGRGTPPSGMLDCPAEYEPMAGLLVRWGYFNPLLTEVVAGFAQPGAGETAYILARNSSDVASATTALTAAGADMSHVSFIMYTSDTGWIRDYGPHFVWQDETRAVVDPLYGSSRPRDDAFPDALAALWHEPAYDLPLYHFGGNFLPTADGEVFVSSIILDYNPSFSEAEIRQLFRDFYDLEMIIYTALPQTIDLTGHIDMWMLPLSEDKVIVSEFAHSSPTYPGITITEAGAADLVARGYTVYRTPALNNGSNGYNGVHYTYTNAVILNDKVFIPRYGGVHSARDAEALAVYQAALPTHTIIPVNCADAITYAGAIHCLSMHVPARTVEEPAAKVLAPNGGETCWAGQALEITWAASDNVGVTSIDLYLSTDGGVTFPHTIATGEAHDGRYLWTVPALPALQGRIKVVAHDAGLNTGSDVSDADFMIFAQPPQPVYSFPLDTNPGWTADTGWAFGAPLGMSGDPTGGHTGMYVYGYNLSGAYPANMPARHLTTPVLDCTGLVRVTLSFWRYLGVHYSDTAALSLSTNGSTWQTLWSNAGTTITDSVWTYQEFDLSALADGAPTVYLRWTLGPSNATSQSFGWNIDDIELRALVPQTVCPGDANCDAVINWRDIDYFVAAMNDNVAAWEALFAPGAPTCAFANNDANADGTVNWRDIDALVALMNTACP